MDQPDFVTTQRAQARSYVEKGAIKDVIFSHATYQVQVKDRWTFLQFDRKDHLKDAFCDCEQEGCVHLAAAYLYLMGDKQKLLHYRFEASFWNALTHLCVRHYGYEPDQLPPVRAQSDAGKALIAQLFEERLREREDSSIKFSDLDPAEVTRWREGRPSEELMYELSVWSGLGKWMFKNNEQAVISFEEPGDRLPSKVRIEFPDLTFTLPLEEAEWRSLVLTLSTVHSPLAVHTMGGLTQYVARLDRKTGELQLDRHEAASSPKIPSSALPFGNWLYVKGQGFYKADHEDSFKSRRLPADAVADFLSTYADKIEFEGVKLHTEAQTLQVRFHFDKAWNLHLDAYLNTPGDLDAPGCRLYRGWLYQARGEGHLYRLRNGNFPALKQEISRAEVGEFVSDHRVWFNTIDGFHIHLTRMETQLSYSVDSDGILHFEARMPEGPTVEFGRWIYVPGEGFYEKRKGDFPAAVTHGLTLEPHEVPRFLQRHREELDQIPGFFTSLSAIQDCALSITLDDHSDIVIEPHYTLNDSVQGKLTHFYYPFVYVEGLGFSEVPLADRLPAGYGERRVVEQPALGRFLIDELPKLLLYAKKVDPRLRPPERLELLVDECQELDQGTFRLRLSYRSEFGTSGVSPLLDAKEMHHRFCFSEAGMLDIEEGRFTWLEGAVQGDGIVTFSTLELLRLHALESLRLENPAVAEKLQHLLQDLSAPEPPDLRGLKSDLRPYQEVGVHWLYYLYHYGLSGLLCDDMGLGKTHQSMALIVAAMNRKKDSRHRKKMRFLVVCPTSVVYHWQDKLSQFLPKLRVRTYYGPHRTLKLNGEPYDLILTSYGVLRRDRRKLGKLAFDLVIYDEIQIAKNHESHIYSALSSIQARTRLGLTGTPIENRLRELKSLFDLVLPGYMPDESAYRDRFVLPIERENSEAAKQQLSRVISPFVLRRVKSEVLTDLPDKVEEVSRCELLEEQKILYNAVIAEGRHSLLQQLENDQSPVPYMHVFAMLTRLKQICDHPAVYHKDAANYRDYSSGKWDLFLELLEEARGSGQKVVVFSQYLAMLDIIEAYLKESGIQYASVRGSTVERGREIERFQTDSKCEVFVGSLQASGMGIDLTAASVVIHYDRWWNAARENQATDRVHRIGQHQGVQVFKMVTSDTLEERVHQMIERKGILMEEIIGTDDQGVLKQLDRAELIALLQGA